MLWKLFLYSAASGGFACAVFWNALTGDFVYDDTYAIVQNPDVYSSSPLANLLKNDFWGFPLQSEKSHKSFRPLTTLTFRVEMSQMGNTADKQVANMMHRTNVILHGINTALLVPLYRKLGFSGKECFIASMLFACHPVHAEAVANLVGRAELLAALFTILSILLWSPSNKRWPLSMLLGSLALLCKETAAVVALPMCTVMQTLKPPKKPASRLKTVLPLLLLAVLLAARVSLHGGIHQRPFLHRESNPAAFAENMATRILSLHFYLYRHLVLLLWPNPLCCDWSHGSIPLLHSFADMRSFGPFCVIYGLPAALLGLASCHASRSYHRGLLSSSALMALSIVPFSNVLFTVGFAVAERVLYIPSIAACSIMAHILCVSLPALPARGPPARLCRCVILMIVVTWCGSWARSCLKQSLVWGTAESLYRAGIDANPSNEKLHDLLATRLQNSGGDLQEAMWHAEEAIRLNDDYWHAHATLGQLRSTGGDRSAAIASYTKALRLAEDQQLDTVADAPKVRLNLAVQLQDVDRHAAEGHFRRLCLLPASDPLRAMGLVIFGAFLESGARGRREPLEEAAYMYEEALRSSALEHRSAAHLRLGSVIRRLALTYNESLSGHGVGAPVAPSCSEKSATLQEPGSRIPSTWWQVWKCMKEFNPKTEVGCDKEIDLVTLGPCHSSSPVNLAERAWQFFRGCTAKEAVAEGFPAISRWPLPLSESMALVQMRQGLELASAPMAQSLDPGGRKWREGLAVVSARLVVEGRMSEASKILAPLGPHLDPAAVLTAMAEEQLKGGDATVALDAYKAALALHPSRKIHLGMAESLQKLGDKAAAVHHRQLAKQYPELSQRGKASEHCA
ncbi:TMTC3 [Symbiodinium necroappetens]|uniref:dolichyl-phosphate-mannose--protein mannosyltransferase n=1 Tax=Symbiodinium necroappetens TaxID=1628268 RepID=A0A812LPQ6_9DINO|nr:TMTC3 [Symbiodinium necroappetens]